MKTPQMIKFLLQLIEFNIEKAEKLSPEKRLRSLKVFSSMKMDVKKSWFFLLVSHKQFYYSYFMNHGEWVIVVQLKFLIYSK